MSTRRRALEPGGERLSQREASQRSSLKDLQVIGGSYANWLNQIERWFAVITQRVIRRGSFRSVPELGQKIDQFVTHHNLHKRPFA
jgi:hypothetical protein